MLVPGAIASSFAARAQQPELHCSRATHQVGLSMEQQQLPLDPFDDESHRNPPRGVINFGLCC